MTDRSRVRRRFGIGLAVVLCSGLLVAAYVRTRPVVRESSPFGYRGYSEEICEGWVGSSSYITTRDGTQLAADIFRPAQDGRPHSEPLPVLWMHTRYQRAMTAGNGEVRDILQRNGWMKKIIRHGYVLAVVDVRGSGASFGVRDGPFMPQEATDAFDVTEWLAAQPWCNGRVGMYGQSYMGIAQYLAAAEAPPHLKAIFPIVAGFDLYSTTYEGGVFHDDFVLNWSREVRYLDLSKNAAPVAGDVNLELHSQASRQHWANRYAYDIAAGLPYRDSVDPVTRRAFYLERSPDRRLDQIRSSRIPIYHLSGWYDIWVSDALLLYANLDHPQKILIGPWPHRIGDFDKASEHLRWFDYWLKDIDNGIMDEPSIHYYTMEAPEGQRWRTARQWPLPTEQRTEFYFHAGRTGTVASVNDGFLEATLPADSGHDTYVVNYHASTGYKTRWTAANGGQFGYGDMTANDARGLTFTTRPLAEDVEVTGHPVVSLWITSTAGDGNFFAYLEAVDDRGVSHYITEGKLKASHRATSEPPYDHLGLPYHRSHEEDLQELPDHPVELRFKLHPTSYFFRRGHRIRVTITCADRDNASSPVVEPPPKITLYRNKQYASHVVLPVIPLTGTSTYQEP